jgi:hypothetical protein
MPLPIWHCGRGDTLVEETDFGATDFAAARLVEM